MKKPLKYKGWFIETNGRDFRPYYTYKVTERGFFKKRIVERRQYIRDRHHLGNPKIFKTLVEAKIGIEEENFNLNQKHNWRTIEETTDNDMRQKGQQGSTG